METNIEEAVGRQSTSGQGSFGFLSFPMGPLPQQRMGTSLVTLPQTNNRPATHHMWHHRLPQGIQYLKLKQPLWLSTRKATLMTMPETTTTSLLEEEKSSSYDPESYYPARIGETIHGKYRLISKLGWGTGSTVWLAGVVSR